jgi:hypothetical protein
VYVARLLTPTSTDSHDPNVGFGVRRVDVPGLRTLFKPPTVMTTPHDGRFVVLGLVIVSNLIVAAVGELCGRHGREYINWMARESGRLLQRLKSSYHEGNS